MPRMRASWDYVPARNGSDGETVVKAHFIVTPTPDSDVRVPDLLSVIRGEPDNIVWFEVK